MLKKIIAFASIALLTACGEPSPPDVSKYPKSPFKGVKVGKPYKIMGKWYSPHHNPNYNEVGIASWYGPNFHGRKTANGERYDQHGYSAAHTTLPMPSIVRVTNLENGRAMNLRVNDRGPFHEGRIIDLSKSAAKKLGVIATGVAKVRVQYLHAETERFIASKGKVGAELRYTHGETDYAAAPANPRMIHPKIHHFEPEKPIKQDIRELPIEPAGMQVFAPSETISVASLPDITPREVEAYEAPWIIQVASYADTVNAEQMMKRLLNLGQPLVQEVAVKGQSFYRVILKPTARSASRSKLLSQLESRFGIDDAKVITQ